MSWISRSGPRWLTAAPASPSSRQKGRAYRTTTLAVAPIHTGVAAAVRARGSGRGGSKASDATASAGASAAREKAALLVDQIAEDDRDYCRTELAKLGAASAALLGGLFECGACTKRSIRGRGGWHPVPVSCPLRLVTRGSGAWKPGRVWPEPLWKLSSRNAMSST